MKPFPDRCLMQRATRPQRGSQHFLLIGARGVHTAHVTSVWGLKCPQGAWSTLPMRNLSFWRVLLCSQWHIKLLWSFLEASFYQSRQNHQDEQNKLGLCLTLRKEVESSRVYFTFSCINISAKSESINWTRLGNRCIPLISYLLALPRIVLELHQKHQGRESGVR